MTSIRNILLACSVCCCITATTILSSCTSEVDDYFDQSATKRLSTTIDRARQILRAAPYGWEFGYFPGRNLEYGGMIYTVRFDSLKATVSCSLVPDSTETTLYRMTNDSGPVLTFDSYNSLFHYFSTPNRDEYEAKGGEFEFVIDSLAEDFIALYGKKSHNSMYLRRLEASPDEYAQKTINIFDHFVDSICGTIGNAEVRGKCSPSTRGIEIISDTDTIVAHFAYTDRGIRLYRPLVLGGHSVQSLDFDVETLQFTCTDAGSESVTLRGVPFGDDFMSFPMYEGDYSLTFGTSSSVDVHMKPNRLEGTYLLQGLSPNYDLVVRYDAETGDLKLGSQVIGEYEGNTVYWSCVNYTGSSISNISITDESQFTIHWNGNRFYPRYNFSATNGASYNSAVVIYTFRAESGALTASVLNDGGWLGPGGNLFANLKSLNRKNRLE